MPHFVRFARHIAPLTLMAVALHLAPPARAQSMCEIYTVKKGDDLSHIARTAGLEGGYQLLFSANRDVLDNANIVEIGVRLKIPCADGSLPLDGSAAQPVTIATAPQPDQGAAPLPAIRFLTGGDYAPFTDEDWLEQGMFTELVTTALGIAKPDQDYRVVFINDWGSHLTELLPTGAFDMGFPWFLPDCTKLENLSPSNALRCTDFDATQPFFEAVVGFYTMKGSAYEGATSHEALAGARLCRPDGWFTFDLEAAGLVEPNISMTVAPTQVACWEALQSKEVDIVTFDALPAEADIKALGLADLIVELPAASTVARMHVLTPKTNPNGKAYIALLDAGLEQMRANGQWFAIVSKHLSLAQSSQ